MPMKIIQRVVIEDRYRNLMFRFLMSKRHCYDSFHKVRVILVIENSFL